MKALTILGIAASLVVLFATFGKAAQKEEGLVLYLAFDEGTGDTTKGLSGNGNVGKIYGAKWCNGKIGKALEFNGKDTYVEVPYKDIYNITKEITLAAWIKPSNVSLSNWHGIINGKKSNYGPYLLQTAVGYAELGIYLGGNWTWLRNATKLTDTDFWHIAATYDSKGGDLKIYTNGKLDLGEGTKKGGGPIDGNTPEGIYVGHNYTVDATAWFGGVIDEVAVYNKALTEKGINDLFLGKIKEKIASVDTKGKLATVWAKIKGR